MQRTVDEILEYEKEAYDKVWFCNLMNNMRIIYDNESIEEIIEHRKEILDTYDHIPEDGYDKWSQGYWSGVLGTLRWVMGDEKNIY